MLRIWWREPVELDAHPDASPRRPHRVPDLALESDADRRTDGGYIHGDAAVHELVRRRVVERDAETVHGDVGHLALSPPRR